MEIVLSDPNVKVIFINSFGGLTKTDLIAKEVVEILRRHQNEGKDRPPVVIRLRGTGEDVARKLVVNPI